MNPHNDIEELEGPFEQIAGAPATGSSGSSDSVTITLQINGKTDETLDYGKIDLARMTQLPVLEDKIDRLKKLRDQLQSKKDAGIHTQGDADAIAQLFDQVKQLNDEIRDVSLELTEASGQKTPDPIKLTVRTTPGNTYFKFIPQTPVDVKARPGNPTDSLGDLSAMQSYTESDGVKTISFIPNGNYGTISFVVDHDGLQSNTVTLQITGEFKEDAQKRLDDEIEKAKDDASDVLALSLELLAIGVAVIALAGPYAALLAAVIAALVGLWILSTVVKNLRKKIKKMKKDNKPKIDNLPSKQ